MAKKTVVLVVLDGWGIGQNNESNPIYVVKPQTFEALRRDYPMTSLQASGISVGLPWGEVGNSEVGHLTLGAGKVLYQYYPKITMAIQDGTFFDNQVLKNAIDHAKKIIARSILLAYSPKPTSTPHSPISPHSSKWPAIRRCQK